jgi:hypothetical protein
MTVDYLSRVVLCICYAPLFLFAADDTNDIRRPTIGFRVDYYPVGAFDTSTVQASTTKPIADYTYYGSSYSAKVALGPVVEYRLSKRLSVSGEFHVRPVRYTHETIVRTGTRNPNSSTDTRPADYLTQSSKVNYWEFPALAHYYGLAQHGVLGRTYASAGFQFRHLGQVKSANEYIFADNTEAYDEIPAHPSRSNQLGFVVGIGLRFVDSFKVKAEPEIRFVRWQGATFQGAAYRSDANQLEVGFGLSF